MSECMIEKVVDLIEIAGRLTASTVVVAGGHRVEDLRLVESARDHGIVDRVVLIGPGQHIRQAVEEVGIEIDSRDIVAAEGDEQIAQATVEFIRSGAADIALKGGISTPVINRHMLPLAVRSTVSLSTVFDAACIARGRPMVLTDAGVTTVCNFGRMRDLVRNAVDVTQTVLGIERPRVAILSANEKQIPSLPSTWMGLELARRSWPEAIVCGPLSFDLSTDPESVSMKGLPDLPNAEEVAGRADVLVCPGIDTANTVYKLITAMNKYGEASLASITVGFPVPYIILSRSDSVETRLVSIALSAIYAQRSRGKKTQPSAAAAGVFRVLAFEVGRTSIRAALYENSRRAGQAEAPHGITWGVISAKRTSELKSVTHLIRKMLRDWGEETVNAVSTCGKLRGPGSDQAPGTYLVAEKIHGRLVVEKAVALALKDPAGLDRPGILSVALAAELAQELGVPALNVETADLGVLAAARRAAVEMDRAPEDINLAVAHFGEQITVAALREGKIIDRITSPGAAEESSTDREVTEKTAYLIAKELGRAFVAAGCDVEAIVFTGPFAGSEWVKGPLRRRVIRLAPVIVYEDCLETEVLAAAAIDVLSGRRQALRYQSNPET